MDIFELNEIIEREHKYPVTVSKICYPEVEEFYLTSSKLDKSMVGAFYQKFDYQGIRNCLELARNMEEFKRQSVDNVCTGNYTHVAPSQYEYLKLLGWNVVKLNFIQDRPWSIY